MRDTTFYDHYKLWLKENKQTKEDWSYERWINEYCFKEPLRGTL